MNATRWFTLNSHDLAPVFHPANALWASQSASPYEIPSHARASYDEGTGILTIEFRYLEGEAVELIPLNKYISLEVGKTTKRARKMIFDVHSFNRERKCIAYTAEQALNNADIAMVSNREIAARALAIKGSTMLEAAFG